ncbi:MAG: MFS transporter [Synechococcaceae bacterium WB8_1B_136]|nr:MFS transporter [Synechococcaceae bacterium WB8_1B_136]
MGTKTVQAYIEEVPAWETGAPLNGPVLSSTQWLVWGLATAGKFFEGLIVFMGGIALPLVSRQFDMTSTEKGLVTAATLFGVLLGALFLGGLADRWGRKPVFVGEMLLLAISLVGASFSVNTAMLVVCLFVIGLALGADYPTAHLVISESIPARIRGRLVLGAFSFQALGAVLATAISALFLTLESSLDLWRQLYLLPVLPVLFVVWGRLFLPESSHWLVSKGRVSHATKQLQKLLNRRDIELTRLELAEEGQLPQHANWRQLFRGRYRRATILASLPWFLQDLSTYGIGIFTPVIIAAAFGANHDEHNVAAVIHNALLGAKGTALVDVGFLIGISVAIVLADRWGRIPLQIIGFIGCAVGLLIATVGNMEAGTNLPVIVTGFFLFQFMTNLGPNAQTYLLAGEVFPTHLRGLGAGFAAASGKVGAVITAFFFPSLLQHLGIEKLLPLLALTSILGALITWIYRIETRGMDLEGP